ncbi:SusC/RagA family TonB-linked outer membrane protein [Rufibacter latericius]|uniref:TonB-dependent receptor n=1 Tax=Rufibacter latericius TaxID=2487040 RepID=A0A3M9N333_9BACT|nr:TonB-dependent receptor [Rufibacter latericius]RNI31438.1 TonB-dependent receptor [Rufibacter latericius]
MKRDLPLKFLLRSYTKRNRGLWLKVILAGFCFVTSAVPTVAAGEKTPKKSSHQPVKSKRATKASSAFEFQVKGKVTDSKGEALIGASVSVKGTSLGTITDVNGNYALNAPDGNSTLVVSYLGYLPLEVPINGKATLNVTLQEDQTKVDEVVVVAYGTQRKISNVGAQSSVSVKELDQPVANISTMLAGRVAGVTGVQRSGQPGYDGADIWIRGIASMSGGSGPLVLVDGVERSMNNIDPQDVESFTILKDASATAVYGVRGANGVILIMTKRGEEGKPRVTFDYNQGITRFTKVPELIDGVDYMNLTNEAEYTRREPGTSGPLPKYSQEIINKTASGEDPFVYPNVNWLDEVFENFGRNRNANLNVSGGSPQAKYYVSLGYYDETGLFNTDAIAQYNATTRFTRYNVTSNVTLDLTKSTKVDLGIQGYIATGNYPAESAADIYGSALEISPIEYPVMYPGGFVPGRSSNGGSRNPYADAALRGYQNENKNQLFSNLRITQKLDRVTEGLSATAMFAFDAFNQHFIERSKREDTWIVDPNNPRNPDGTLNLGTAPTFSGQNFLSYGRSNGGNRRFYMEGALNYDRAFGKHRVSGMVLGNRSDLSDAFAGNFQASIPYRNEGVAGRATYSFDDRYFAEVNIGYNGSENFDPNRRYGFFPAFGLGWVVSNEKFFEPLSNTINFLKLRYTDGKVGQDSGAGRFAFLGEVRNKDDRGDNIRGYTFGRNRAGYGGIIEQTYGVAVTWVEARKQDIGIEINAFNSSLGIIFDVFKDRRVGAFVTRGDVPAYIGLTSIPSGNLGISENKGFDGTITYDKNIRDFSIGFRGTFSYNRNKVLENDQPAQLYPWLERRGTPLLANWGLTAEGLYSFEDDVNGDGFITPEDGDQYPAQYGKIQPGDIRYKDLNGDGRIDANDVSQIGQGDVPALTYGFGTSLGYKGLDISFFFQGQAEADIILEGRSIRPFSGDGGGENLYTIALDRWTEENPNPNAFYPRLSYGSGANGSNNNNQISSWWVKDIDFLRLKTAEIGYTIPSAISGKIGVGNARVYLRGVNLLTFSNFKLWDPELLTRNGARYPNISVYSLGFNLQF